jgi:hypothetical protein
MAIDVDYRRVAGAAKGGRMDAWTFGAMIMQALIASLVLAALTWAATERGKVHRFARRLRTWRALMKALRAVPRSHRLHLALGAIGEWV